MSDVCRDLVFGLRSLRKAPGFTAISVAVLALGIGANAAIFSLVDEIWLRPMPVPHPERLTRVFTSEAGSEGVVARGAGSYPDFESLRSAVPSFSGIAALERRGAQLDTGTENRLVTAAVVSGNFFDVLRPAPAAGRTFTEKETANRGVRVAMLSHPFWRQQFHGDPALPGRTIVLDRQPVLVAGILPRGFRSTEPWSIPDVWIPAETWVALTGERSRLVARGTRDWDLFARLRPDARIERTRVEVATVADRLARAFPATNAGRRITLLPEKASRAEGIAKLSSLLLAIAGLVLLIACANVASLLLARAEHRRYELATRVALGATRGRLARQMLAETSLLAAIAGAAALLVGSYLIALVPRLLTGLSFSADVDVHMSPRVILFAALASAFSLVVCGVLPAWQASAAAPASALQNRATDGHARLRSALVVIQVAFCLTLAVSGVLLVRSLLLARRADPGFDAHQEMLVLELVPGFGPSGADAQRACVEEARRRLDALPGVAGTAAGMRIPFGLSGSGATRKLYLADGARGPAEGVPVHFDPVSDRFFELLGTPIVRGRPIEARDMRAHARVVVVNETMARRFWPGSDPVGRSLRLDRAAGDPYQVVGVARDSVNSVLGENPVPYLYVPMGEDDWGELALVVKTRTDAGTLAAAVRRTLREVDRNVPIVYLATLREHMRLATAEQGATTGLIVSLGGMGLILAAVGLYGLTSFLVRRRRREIGIRLALGAPRKSIFELVVGRALFLVIVGIALGGIGAAVAARALRSFLFGVAPGDPSAYFLGVLILLIAAGAAAFLPALEASRVDPAAILKCE